MIKRTNLLGIPRKHFLSAFFDGGDGECQYKKKEFVEVFFLYPAVLSSMVKKAKGIYALVRKNNKQGGKDENREKKDMLFCIIGLSDDAVRLQGRRKQGKCSGTGCSGKDYGQCQRGKGS